MTGPYGAKGTIDRVWDQRVGRSRRRKEVEAANNLTPFNASIARAIESLVFKSTRGSRESSCKVEATGLTYESVH